MVYKTFNRRVNDTDGTIFKKNCSKVTQISFCLLGRDKYFKFLFFKLGTLNIKYSNL